MSKFKINSMNIPKNNRVDIGVGLLNEVSKEIKIDQYTEEMYIKFTDIEVNDKNDYSMLEEEILELMASIRIIGLQQNPIVRPNDEGAIKPYKMTGGHRRTEALRRLYSLGEWSDGVRCKIVHLDKIELPLSDELKEEFLIMETNSKTRTYTDHDKLMEIKKYDRIFTELRKNGYSFVETPDGEHIQIAGVKNRKLIADKLKMSQSQIAKGKEIINNAEAEVMKAIKEGTMNINVADQVVSLSPEEQREIISIVEETEDEKITTKMVTDYKEKIKDIREDIKITAFDIEAICNRIKAVSNISLGQEKYIKAKEYDKYMKATETILKILK